MGRSPAPSLPLRIQPQFWRFRKLWEQKKGCCFYTATIRETCSILDLQQRKALPKDLNSVNYVFMTILRQRQLHRWKNAAVLRETFLCSNARRLPLTLGRRLMRLFDWLNRRIGGPGRSVSPCRLLPL